MCGKKEQGSLPIGYLNEKHRLPHPPPCCPKLCFWSQAIISTGKDIFVDLLIVNSQPWQFHYNVVGRAIIEFSPEAQIKKSSKSGGYFWSLGWIETLEQAKPAEGPPKETNINPPNLGFCDPSTALQHPCNSTGWQSIPFST